MAYQMKSALKRSPIQFAQVLPVSQMSTIFSTQQVRQRIRKATEKQKTP